MLDPDLQKELDLVNTNLVAIRAKKNPGIWRSFFNGMFGALGYIAGLALVIVLLGWFLNKTGLLPQFQDEMKSFQVFMKQAEKLMGASDSQPTNNTQTQQGSSVNGSYMITLPNGQKAQVTPQ